MALFTGSYRADPQSDNWIGHAVAEVLDLDSDDKDDRKRIRAILKTWIKNAVLREVDRKDDKRMTRTFIEPGDWQY